VYVFIWFCTAEQWVCANSARYISPVLFTLPNLLLHYFYWPVNSKANCQILYITRKLPWRSFY
jgi:hypothetical protein